MSACELARLYRIEGDDLVRDHRRRPEDDHAGALLAAARLWYMRSLIVLLFWYAETKDRE